MNDSLQGLTSKCDYIQINCVAMMLVMQTAVQHCCQILNFVSEDVGKKMDENDYWCMCIAINTNAKITSVTVSLQCKGAVVKQDV